MLGNSRIFGYYKDKGKLVIDETKAPMVRQLFEERTPERTKFFVRKSRINTGFTECIRYIFRLVI